jgi:hypothetical protein
VKVERKSPSPVRVNEASPGSQPQSRTELVIPKVPQPLKLVGSGARISSCSSAQPSSSTPSNGVANAKVEKLNSVADVKVEKSNSDVKVERSHKSSSPDVEVIEIQDRGTKRKIGNSFLSFFPFFSIPCVFFSFIISCLGLHFTSLGT